MYEYTDSQYLKNGKQPLVLSFGDPLVALLRVRVCVASDFDIGLGMVHIAFSCLVGKTARVLKTMDTLGTSCFRQTCPVLKLQYTEKWQACAKGEGTTI